MLINVSAFYESIFWKIIKIDKQFLFPIVLSMIDADFEKVTLS